jgi:hypothetical protein
VDDSILQYEHHFAVNLEQLFVDFLEHFFYVLEQVEDFVQ